MAEVHTYDSPSSFLDAAEPFLLRHEALNSLLLGVVQSQNRTRAARRRFQPLLATVAEAGELRLAALMTSPHKLLLSSILEDSGQVIEALVLFLHQRLPTLPAVFGPDRLSLAFADVWAARRQFHPLPGLQQLLYELTEVDFPPDLPVGVLRPASLNDRGRLAEWMLAFQQEALPSDVVDLESARVVVDHLVGRNELYVWQAEPDGLGRPLSMAARARPTRNGVAVNFVYTPPELRGHGFASACVAHLSHYLLGGWKFVTLFTDRANPTSNHIYERMGYRPIAQFDEYRFFPSPR